MESVCHAAPPTLKASQEQDDISTKVIFKAFLVLFFEKKKSFSNSKVTTELKEE